MPRKRKVNTTKTEIIQTATRMFLEKGFTNTSVKSICDELDISTGNLTFHFPSKEHLLAILVEMLCDFQWKIIERALDEGATSLQAVCLELPAMAAVCAENEIAKDFYLSAYTHPMSLEIIRKNDIAKAKQVFGCYCPDWTQEQYMAAEVLISGIEYATLMATPSSAPLHTQIMAALDTILTVYQVPCELRQAQLQKVLSMDYRTIGRRILQEFAEYIETENEQALEALRHNVDQKQE